MFSPTTPTEWRVTATLGTASHYAGSSHDPETARKLGYRTALIPGAFLYGYMTQMAVAAWGRDFVLRGTVDAAFRRPVFDGDALVVHASALRRDASGLRVDMEIHDPEGKIAALGGVGLPDSAADMPDLAHHPVIPNSEAPRPVGAGEQVAGIRLGTRNHILTAAEHAKSLADFHETWPAYAAEGIAHSGLILRASMGDANNTHRYPGPVILVSADTRHLGLAYVGDTISSSGRITQVYERKGHHYFDTEQLMLANNRPVAWVRRSSIYATRPAE
jgi:hypothetical protein